MVALVAQPLGFFEIGAIDLGVVLQLPGLLDAVVKRLAVRQVGVTPAGFEQVATLFGQRDGGRVAIEPNGLNESRVAEVPQLAVARVEGLIDCRGGRSRAQRERCRRWSAYGFRNRAVCSRDRVSERARDPGREGDRRPP